MLFITGEISRQNEIAAYFHNLYDGTPKEYPNGTMMLFIPLNKGTIYSQKKEQNTYSTMKVSLAKKMLYALVDCKT